MTSQEELKTAIGEIAVEGKASCKALLALAEKLDVSPKQIGEACNEINVRVSTCQLGCFG